MSYEDNSRVDSRLSIKSCPFCGQRAEVVYYLHNYQFAAIVRCTACDTEKQIIQELNRSTKTNPAYLMIQAEHEAIDVWNQRAGND